VSKKLPDIYEELSTDVKDIIQSARGKTGADLVSHSITAK